MSCRTRSNRVELFQRLARAVRARGVEAGLLEQQGQRDLDGVVVVDDQYAPPAL
jgi:hypothetical protein